MASKKVNEKLFQYMRRVVAEPRLLRVTLVKSGAEAPPRVRAAMNILKLRKLNASVVHKNNAPIRGMINQLKQYVIVANEALPPQFPSLVSSSPAASAPRRQAQPTQAAK